MKQHVVIGGATGIGSSLVEKLASSGEKVWATINKTTPIFNHPNVEYTHFDVLKDEFPDCPFEKIDSITYCVGAIQLKPFGRVKEEDFLEDYRLQVLGAVKVVQSLLVKLKQSENASIVMFSTVAVGHGFPFHSIVSASKGAVEGLARSWAAEFAPKIRVNIIAPSLTNTPMARALLSTPEKIDANAQRHPLKTIGEAEDVASLAEFLISYKARWITGQVIGIDGGMSSLKV